MDWLRNYRIVLGFEKLTHVLDQDPPAIPACPTAEQRASLERWMDNDNKIRYYMLGAMSDDLQHQHENILTTVKYWLTYKSCLVNKVVQPSIKSVKDFLRLKCVMDSQFKIII